MNIEVATAIRTSSQVMDRVDRIGEITEPKPQITL